MSDIKQVIITFEEWETSKYRTLEWERSVKMVRWECDYEKEIYIIDYKEI